MLRSILIDDEDHALNELEYLLTNKKNLVNIIGSYTDPEKALSEVDWRKIDLVFLDIEMPIINGLDAAREIHSYNKYINIVFVTAFNDYAYEAFKVNAIDYILKPINEEKLTNKIIELNTTINLSSAGNALWKKINEIEKHLKKDNYKIIAYDDDELVFLNIQDVLFIESESKSTYITTKHRRYKSKNTLDLWETRLVYLGFFRCHRSFIINLNYLKKISPMFNNNNIVKLHECNIEIPISRRYFKKLKELYDY